jgi:hypothetical protein
VSFWKFLEPRRLRLYVVAYLRGFLKPYYEHTHRSEVREELILKALSDELDASSVTHSLYVDSIFWNDQSDRTGVYNTMYDKIEKIRQLNELTPNTLVKSKRANDVDNLEKLYMILKDTGIMTKLSKKITNNRKEVFKDKYNFGMEKE